MLLTERALDIPIDINNCPDIAKIAYEIQQNIGANEDPIRFVITESDSHTFKCEIGVCEHFESGEYHIESVFKFKRRALESCEKFNVVMLIPTGVGCEIGGHAGDATPVAQLLSNTCDNLILHPNVVNGSDLNEMPNNSLYIEGSILTKLMMGTVGLQRVRSNRLLLVAESNKNRIFVNAAINAVNAARATYGLDCIEFVELNPSFTMHTRYSSSGRATGEVKNFECLSTLIDSRISDFDALALSSIIKVPQSYHMDYFNSGGKMINPWGGVEALLTHAISLKHGLASAHSPMFESEDIANMDPGIVDSRMAAEAISLSFLQCILKGLLRSPKIVTEPELLNSHNILSAKDISALVVPEGCLGLPTLAALHQGIIVIEVKGNKNIMKNDLAKLPWSHGQFYSVDNYLEAVGVIEAIKSGISIESLKRPFKGVVTRIINQNIPPTHSDSCWTSPGLNSKFMKSDAAIKTF